MPGTWESMHSVKLPPQIEDNFEDQNKKLGEGNFASLVLDFGSIVQ